MSGLDESGAGAAAQPAGLAALLIALPDGARGTLTAHHLSDHPAHVAPLHARLARAGAELGELVVLRHEHKKAVLTRKPLLVAAAKAAGEEAARAAQPARAKSAARGAVRFPATIGDVVVGSLICAVVSNVTKFGEFSFMYRYILRESCSQFDSLPLTYSTISGGLSRNDLRPLHTLPRLARAALGARLRCVRHR